MAAWTTARSMIARWVPSMGISQTVVAIAPSDRPQRVEAVEPAGARSHRPSEADIEARGKREARPQKGGRGGKNGEADRQMERDASPPKGHPFHERDAADRVPDGHQKR